jgi:hypothetical protein
MSHGGKRTGAGRKPIHDEIAAKEIAVKSIISVYGSLEDGMKALLLSTEPSLIKFVYEHAFGKPADKIQHTGEDGNPIIFKLDGRFKAD